MFPGVLRQSGGTLSGSSVLSRVSFCFFWRSQDCWAICFVLCWCPQAHIWSSAHLAGGRQGSSQPLPLLLALSLLGVLWVSGFGGLFRWWSGPLSGAWLTSSLNALKASSQPSKLQIANCYARRDAGCVGSQPAHCQIRAPSCPKPRCRMSNLWWRQFEPTSRVRP